MVEYCNKCHGDLGCFCSPEETEIETLKERISQLEQKLQELKTEAEIQITKAAMPLHCQIS